MFFSDGWVLVKGFFRYFFPLTRRGPLDNFSAIMPVYLIIDGYNLLGVRGHAGRAVAEDLEKQRERLLQDLSRYHQKKKHPMTVVFDAWRRPGCLEHRDYRSGIQVIYTRSGERADAVIQRMARQYGADCAIVSSDLEVIQTAKACRSFVMRSQEFQGKLEIALGGEQKITSGPAKLLVHEEEREREPRAAKRGNPRRLPKSQRVRERRLKRF